MKAPIHLWFGLTLWTQQDHLSVQGSTLAGFPLRFHPGTPKASTVENYDLVLPHHMHASFKYCVWLLIMADTVCHSTVHVCPARSGWVSAPIRSNALQYEERLLKNRIDQNRSELECSHLRACRSGLVHLVLDVFHFWCWQWFFWHGFLSFKQINLQYRGRACKVQSIAKCMWACPYQYAIYLHRADYNNIQSLPVMLSIYIVQITITFSPYQ